MTSASEQSFNMPLGVGAIFGESFSILFKNFIPVMIMSFVPVLLSVVIPGFFIGFDIAVGVGAPDLASGAAIAGQLLMPFIQMVFYALATALLVQLAYDAKLGRPLQLGRYVSRALRAVVPITILSLGASILTMLGLVALVIPGLWLYAVFSVMAPAVVIEGAGFGGLGRSAALTKEYRWPILGALILLGICVFVVSFVALFIAGTLSGGTIALMVILVALINALGAGLGGIMIALIYARLRDIKEGVSVDQIASVFD